jgi:hypothetical protein
MKKTFIGLLIGAILGLVFGYFITKYLLIGTVPTGYVCVTVRNESGQHIKSVLLKSNAGSIETKSLNNKEEVNLIYKNGGEGTYFIVSTFDNDSTLSSKAMYVEGGYKTTEIIFNDHIKSSQ